MARTSRTPGNPLAPIYHRVADTIRDRIVNGTYRVGERIPGGAELEHEFSVSDITIRRALDILSRAGWVRRNRGVGTTVLKSDGAGVLDIRISGNFVDWLETASGAGRRIEQRVLKIDRIKATPRIAQLLRIDAAASVWRMQRIRSMRGQPISYHINYGTIDTCGHITTRDMSGKRTFVEALRIHCSTDLLRMEQQVEAITANLDLSKLLNIEFGAPLFFVENQYVGDAGAAIALTHLYLRADRYRYRTSIALPQA